MPQKIRVTILDDHQSILDGYLYRLEKTPGVEVAAILSFGGELESALEKTPTDVLILDVGAPTAPDNRNPYPILHTIPRLLDRYPDLAILVISMFTDLTLIQALVDAGVNGYIFKDDRAVIQQLGNVVTMVAGGGSYFSLQARELLLKRHDPNDIGQLTARQLEALSLYAAYPYCHATEIAKKMSVSYSTLRNHLTQASLRLGVHNRAAAVARARELGLITPNPPTLPPVEHVPPQSPERDPGPAR